MLRFALIALSLSLTAGNAEADGYTAPEGCELIATMRMSECVVEQVSRCPGGNVSEQFREGQYLGRSVYGHPSLFIRYEAANGYIIGHAYGEGTPALGKTLMKGETYTYDRRVFRNQGDREDGDKGTEVMNVGSEIDLELDGKRYRVVDIRFEVTNPENGYEYRERALMLIEPAMTLGSLGFVKGEEEFSTLPESLSLKGEFGFGSMTPAASCGTES